jgi:phosphate transport system substrate-binding protein
VNKDNPLEKLTLTEVDAIFSKTRTCGAPADIATWGQVGLEGAAWKTKPISIYGRNSASGTYGFFKETALCNGELQGYRQGAARLRVGRPGVDLGRERHRVQRHRLCDLGREATEAREEGGRALLRDRRRGGVRGKVSPVPLSLPVREPRSGKPFDPLVIELLKLILSADGQRIVVKDGYLPLTAAVDEKERAKLK